MSALPLRLPDRTHAPLKALAAQRGVRLNHLRDDLITQTIAEFDAEVRFALRTSRGSNRITRGLELLRKARIESA